MEDVQTLGKEDPSVAARLSEIARERRLREIEAERAALIEFNVVPATESNGHSDTPVSETVEA